MPVIDPVVVARFGFRQFETDVDVLVLFHRQERPFRDLDYQRGVKRLAVQSAVVGVDDRIDHDRFEVVVHVGGGELTAFVAIDLADVFGDFA
ncbi:hypothetical protein D3C76_253440 [compost metagenome]